MSAAARSRTRREYLLLRGCLFLLATALTVVAISLFTPTAAIAEVASGTSGTVAWSISDDGELVFRPQDGTEGTFESYYDPPGSHGYQTPWMEYCDSITSVRFEGTCHATGESARLFCVSTMANTGSNSTIQTIDLNGLDTSGATNLAHMFSNLKGLKTIDGIQDLDTSSATDISWMFFCCDHLQSLDLSKWNTTKVEDFEQMFDGCNRLKELDLSGFDMSSIDDDYVSSLDMFYGLYSLERIVFGPQFKLSSSAYLPNISLRWNDAEYFWSREVVKSVYAYTNQATGTKYSADQLYKAGESGGIAGTYAVSATPADEVFEDVDYSTSHLDDVLWLEANGISTGFPDGTFRPYATVARCDMAAFLYRLVNSPDFDPASSAVTFSDVDESTPHYKEIMWLAATGISKGWDNGDGTYNFRPYADVARCDMAAFLYRLGDSSGFEPSEYVRTYFSDVSEMTPHWNEVLWLKGRGISDGWTEADGTHTFRNYESVARCDMAAFMHRMVENNAL